MELPFTVGQFLEVFKSYNQAIWPIQLAAYATGIAAVYFTLKGRPGSRYIVNGLLTFMWLWTGLAYHVAFFSSINKAAYIFGSLYAVQSLLFLFFGIIKDRLDYELSRGLYFYTGSAFIIYAMIIYSSFGYMLGHRYPYIPVFGVAPCPVVIFTFGILLWSKKSLPLWLIIIPFMWALIGFTAALKLNMIEDYGLLIAGVAGSALLIYRKIKA